MSSSNMKTDYGLDTEHVLLLFDTLRASGVRRVDVVGGEPFLRPDISTLLLHAMHIGLDVVVTTNGSLH